MAFLVNHPYHQVNLADDQQSELDFDEAAEAALDNKSLVITESKSSEYDSEEEKDIVMGDLRSMGKLKGGKKSLISKSSYTSGSSSSGYDT